MTVLNNDVDFKWKALAFRGERLRGLTNDKGVYFVVCPVTPAGVSYFPLQSTYCKKNQHSTFTQQKNKSKNHR
jgi:hypothetical protein